MGEPEVEIRIIDPQTRRILDAITYDFDSVPDIREFLEANAEEYRSQLEDE